MAERKQARGGDREAAKPRPARREGEAVPVIVGFGLKPQNAADLGARMRDHFADTVRAPCNYKDQEKIAAYCAAAIEEYADAARQQPYSATFRDVRLVAPTLRQSLSWSDGDPDGEPPAARAAAWISENWPVYLYGFDVNLFVDVLYTECACRRYRLPAALWLDRSNRPCLAVSSCLVPSGYGKFLTLDMALMAFGTVGRVPPEGFVPGARPGEDVKLVYELLLRLDIIQPAA